MAPRNPRPPRRSRRREKQHRPSKHRRNPDQTGPVGAGPWDAGPWDAFFDSDLEETGQAYANHVIIFPVNPTTVKLAARAYSIVSRYPGYLAAVRSFTESLEPFGGVRDRVFPKGSLDENALGDVLEEVSSNPTLFEVDREAAQEVVDAAGKIHFDLRTPFTGRAENYFPLGLQEEWNAIQPLPNSGILSGQGILDFSSISKDAFQAQVMRLADIVEKTRQPGTAGQYPAVHVGHARGHGGYSLFLLASGNLVSDYSIMPLGVGDNETAVADGLLHSILDGKMWNLSERTWNTGSSMIFALPGPLVNKKGQDLTGTYLFANTVCAPTISYGRATGGSDVALVVTFGPKSRKIVGGRLTIGVDTYVITSGRLVEAKQTYNFSAESAKGRYDGTFSVERDRETKLSFTGTKGSLSATLGRKSATQKCPSPSFQTLLAHAVNRMLQLADRMPFSVLKHLQRGDISEKDTATIQRLAAESRQRLSIVQAGNVIPTLLQRLASSGVVPSVGAASPSDGSWSPLFFVGFGNKAPVDRVFPVDMAALNKALRSDGTFVVKSQKAAQKIGLTSPPPEGATPADRARWDYRDTYHRWVAHGGGMLRVTLVEAKPGEWTYSFRYGDGFVVPPILEGHVLQRESKRAQVAQRGATKVFSEAVQLAAHLLTPLIRSAGEGSLPGLSSLPVAFRGEWCPNPQDVRGELVKCSQQVRKELIEKAQLPLTFYLPAESEKGLSYYGDPPLIRNMPGMRHGFVYARSATTRFLPTLLMLRRFVRAGGDDALAKSYAPLAEEIEATSRDYTIDEVRKRYKEEGEKGAQALESTLFDIRGREARKPNTVPLVRTQQGNRFIPSPVEKAVFTVYAVLNRTNVDAMRRRNEAAGGTDANPKDRAYSQFLLGQSRSPRAAMPGEVTEYIAQQEQAAEAAVAGTVAPAPTAGPSKKFVLKTIISGGQSGADVGGLAAAVTLGLTTGGTAPAGYRAFVEQPPGSGNWVDGAMPELGKLPSGGLKQHTSNQWAPRTRINVGDADGTLWFGNPTSAGGNLTIRTALEGPRAKKWPSAKLAALHGPQVGTGGRKGYPAYIQQWRSGQLLPDPAEFAQWLVDRQIVVLNVAGNREGSQPNIFTAVQDFIEKGVRLAQQTSAQSNPYRRHRSGRRTLPVKPNKWRQRFAARRNPDAPWFPEYGVFYQTAMTIKQIHEKLDIYAIWADEHKEAAEVKKFGYKFPFMEQFHTPLVEERKTMTTRRSGLPRGGVGSLKLSVKEGRYKRKKPYTMHVRSWGKMTFEDFATELGRGDLVRGLNEYVRREVLPTVDSEGQPLPSYRSPAEFAEAQVIGPDGGLISIFPGYARDWIRGRGELVVHDVAFDNAFDPLPEGDMSFNPAYALRKIILDKAGITRPPGSPGGTETLADTWFRKEKGLGNSDIELLAAPFALVGTMQVALRPLGDLPRSLPRALSMTEQTGILLFSMKIPTTKGPGFGPSAEDLDSLYTTVDTPDGLRPAAQSSFSLKQLSEYLTQTEWSRSRRTIMPLVGTPFSLQSILAFDPVSKSHDFERALDKIQKSDQAKHTNEGAPIPPRVVQESDAYYNALSGAVAGFYGSRRVPDAVLHGRVSYSAHGGHQARVKRVGRQLVSPDPSQRVWGTRKGRSYADIFGFASQVCQAGGICIPHAGGKRTEIVALTRPEETYLNAASLFVDLPGNPRELYNNIRLGRISEIEIPYGTAMVEGIEEGVKYLTEVGKRFFHVDALEQEDGFVLVFEPVQQTTISSQNKMFSLMAKLGIEVPPLERTQQEIEAAYEQAKGRKPTKQELAHLVQQERLAGMKALRPALQQLKNQMQLQYKHTMDLGLVPEQMEQAALGAEFLANESGVEPGLQASYAYEDAPINAVWHFAEEYLKDMAKPNPRSKYGRKGRKSASRRSRRRSRDARRNPLDEKEVQAVVEYAQGRGDEEEARAAFTSLREREKDKEKGPSLWNIDKTALDTLFPPQGKERPDTWSPRSRIEDALGPSGFDLVARLSKIRPETVVGLDEEGTPVTAGEVMKQALEKALPFEDQKALNLIMQQAELSLDQALAILQEQRQAVRRRGTKGRFTMQPSSAICKLYRKRKLSTFYLPNELRDQNLSPIDLLNSVVIMMSPHLAPIPRVMSWRRGDHIDCDMVGDSPQALTELLGKSIQSALYWVAEKPQRRMSGKGACTIYVGRVGDPGLYLVWEPGTPVNLETVTVNLGKRTPMAKLWRQNQGREGKEVERYNQAERDLGIGSAKRGARGSWQPGPVTPQVPTASGTDLVLIDDDEYND